MAVPDACNGQVRASEDLLQLSRELKELWLFGPLRKVGEGTIDTKMDEDAAKVGALLESLLQKQAEGGRV